MREASRVAESVGYQVAATMCIVDRLDPAADEFKALYPFYSLFTVRDLLPDSTHTPV